MIITLTTEERLKFAAWLRQDAEASNGLAKQMEKLKGANIMGPHLKAEAAAFNLVAKKLEGMEEQTIG